MPEKQPSSPEAVRRAVASVVIPAHNEQGRIGRTLQTLLMDARDGEFDVVVVCNGCTDATAEEAGTVPGVRVVELEEPSKIAALREGDRQTEVFPRLYLDGDVILTTQAARALANAVRQSGVLAAGVPGRYRLAGSSLPVALFYEFRQRLPVFADGIIGAGVYALSQQGRERFVEWPEVLGDDQFIYRLVATDERVRVSGHHTLVDPAPDLLTIVRRGVRVRQGNRQLTDGASGQESLDPPAAGVRQAMHASFMSGPRGWASIAVFVGVTVFIRLRTWLTRSSRWV